MPASTRIDTFCRRALAGASLAFWHRRPLAWPGLDRRRRSGHIAVGLSTGMLVYDTLHALLPRVSDAVRCGAVRHLLHADLRRAGSRRRPATSSCSSWARRSACASWRRPTICSWCSSASKWPACRRMPWPASAEGPPQEQRSGAEVRRLRRRRRGRDALRHQPAVPVRSGRPTFPRWPRAWPKRLRQRRITIGRSQMVLMPSAP